MIEKVQRLRPVTGKHVGMVGTQSLREVEFSEAAYTALKKQGRAKLTLYIFESPYIGLSLGPPRTYEKFYAENEVPQFGPLIKVLSKTVEEVESQ